jgi:predicted membrane GTPase involved in stress response
VRIGKYAIPVLLLATLAIGTIAATIFVVLTYTMSLTVVPFPAVNFVKWSTGARENTFTESFNIFPDVKTIQDNATYGIVSTAAKDCSMQISSITTPGNIAEVYMKVFNSTDTIVEITYSTDGNDWMPFTTASANYTIWMEVTGAGGASGSSAVDLNMRVENP